MWIASGLRHPWSHTPSAWTLYVMRHPDEKSLPHHIPVWREYSNPFKICYIPVHAFYLIYVIFPCLYMICNPTIWFFSDAVQPLLESLQDEKSNLKLEKCLDQLIALVDESCKDTYLHMSYCKTFTLCFKAKKKTEREKNMWLIVLGDWWSVSKLMENLL